LTRGTVKWESGRKGVSTCWEGGKIGAGSGIPKGDGKQEKISYSNTTLHNILHSEKGKEAGASKKGGERGNWDLRVRES